MTPQLAISIVLVAFMGVVAWRAYVARNGGSASVWRFAIHVGFGAVLVVCGTILGVAVLGGALDKIPDAGAEEALLGGVALVMLVGGYLLFWTLRKKPKERSSPSGR